MSDSRTNSERTRRRASRRAGPPVDAPGNAPANGSAPGAVPDSAATTSVTGAVAPPAETTDPAPAAAARASDRPGPAASDRPVTATASSGPDRISPSGTSEPTVVGRTAAAASSSGPVRASASGISEPALAGRTMAAASFSEPDRVPAPGAPTAAGAEDGVAHRPVGGSAAAVQAQDVPDETESSWTYVDLTQARPADVPATADPTADTHSVRRNLGVLGWAATVVAVLSLVLLVGAGGVFVYHQRHADAMAERRTEYVQTAKQAILNLTNIKDDTAAADIDRVLSVASGQLKAEYSSQKDAYAKVVQQAKVKAHGEIVDAALESDDAGTARVLVAATQTLTNAGSAEPSQRTYRFRVTVTRDDSGAVTASEVEFVA
ncbi:hypothetical protein [Nocardia aurantia]|uniref:Mce-associated membrane protein n=1 Tax=Nocardia aurantia TaxID=2585199 RepID=A0A7K0DG69_9NOCA|nr:hypothetical protein [Nocardia aurantia]MQY24637.1 hypothetical protein [Nocardia aurantia]